MALDARALRAAASSVPGAAHDDVGAWSGNGRGDEASLSLFFTMGAAASVDVPVLMGDERRIKQELVAWAKAVASMAVRESMHC
ncbi:hypothetical protein EJB05_37812, partial [Eragrostis curvula]